MFEVLARSRSSSMSRDLKELDELLEEDSMISMPMS